MRGLKVFLDTYGFMQADIMGVSEADGYLAAQINMAKRAAKNRVGNHESETCHHQSILIILSSQTHRGKHLSQLSSPQPMTSPLSP